ncbi:cytochrome P450 [Zafaria cholistanensis]|uniref:Cytochrome P450 n=1 Tax=Zafaria cholistanensis TaxID=1682741 RepID=A0A5A7NRJ9_9MICC|nr:cytochrome P450 [Zafaria cholistanensis]
MRGSTELDGRIVLEIDPFSREGLLHPAEVDRTVREAGDVVWLEKHGIWATGRHAVVEQVFRDYATFESSSGTGLTNIKKEANWRKPSVILENDPPDHARYRRVMASVLSQRVVRRLRDGFRDTAVEIVDRALAQGSIDGAKQLAEAFPLAVLPDAIGFSPEGRENLLPYSNLNFQAQGPRNEFYWAAVEESKSAVPYVDWQIRREALAPGGLGRDIYAFADSGDISEEDAAMLVRTFLSAGVDTTIFGIQFALKALAENPGAWAALKQDPGLAKAVFEESLRCYAPSPYIGRTTACETRIGETAIGAGEKILLMLSAANHDPRFWDRPEEFDISRDTSGHLAFGTGVHGCVGQMMARMEAITLLTVLAERADVLELAGEPVPFLSNWLRGFESLPLRIGRSVA